MAAVWLDKEIKIMVDVVCRDRRGHVMHSCSVVYFNLFLMLRKMASIILTRMWNMETMIPAPA